MQVTTNEGLMIIFQKKQPTNYTVADLLPALIGVEN